MADFNPLTIPQVMPDSVQRTESRIINGKEVPGYPTKFMLDWEQAQTTWFQTTTVQLNTKIEEVSEVAGDATAAVAAEAIARANGDGALAASITTVDAKANNATANGQIYFAAKAAPSGATAAYGMYLTAGSAFAGIEAIAQSGGGSAIALTANQFFFRDSGSQFQPFVYSGGTTYLNGAVVFAGSNGSGTTAITGSLIQVFDTTPTLRVRMGVW